MIDRQGYNREIIRTLSVLAEENPHLRFSQILQAFEFVKRCIDPVTQVPIMCFEDEFYTEPDAVLNRVRAAIERMKK